MKSPENINGDQKKNELTRVQKSAIFILLIIAIWPLYFLLIRLSLPDFQALEISASIWGLWGLSVLFYRRKEEREKEIVVLDERDKTIMNKAQQLAFISICMYLGFVYPFVKLTLITDEMIPEYYLTFFILGNILISMATYAISILVLYSRGEVGYEES